MGSNPLVLWIGIAFIELIVAMIVMGYTVKVQVAQFKFKSSLQPLKRWLLSALVTLIVFNLPLLNVYSAALLGQKVSVWETALAIMANATGHLIFAIFLLLVYRFRGVE